MFLDDKSAGEAKTAEQANRKLKISEAIRIGARLRPKCTGRFFSEAGESCALGAAWEAMGLNPDDANVYEDVCPRLGISYELGQAIAIRNDGFGLGESPWSRERIADWLESQGY